jgi:hypothetical protein
LVRNDFLCWNLMFHCIHPSIYDLLDAHLNQMIQSCWRQYLSYQKHKVSIIFFYKNIIKQH